MTPGESKANVAPAELSNGNDKNELPLTATYVIDKNGQITYAFLDADYKKRANPADIIAAIQAAIAE